jgi:hypothetical protein
MPSDADALGLNWHRIAEQDTAAVARGLRSCADAEVKDGQATFLWRLRVIVHVRALYAKVQLPRSHADHIPSTEWKAACKTFGGVGSTYAAAIAQRKLVDAFTPRQIVAKVAGDGALRRRTPPPGRVSAHRQAVGVVSRPVRPAAFSQLFGFQTMFFAFR